MCPGSGTSNVRVSASITGLKPNRTDHYRLWRATPSARPRELISQAFAVATGRGSQADHAVADHCAASSPTRRPCL